MGRMVNGYRLKAGDRVRVIDATCGAYGANGGTGTVVTYVREGTSKESIIGGLPSFRTGTLIIKMDKPTGAYGRTYWRVGKAGTYELIEDRRKHYEVDVVIKGDTTKVIVNNEKVGISKCKEEDTFIEAFGVILAIANAYNLSKEKREALVDALYGDNKKLEDYDSVELLDELKSRVED